MKFYFLALLLLDFHLGRKAVDATNIVGIKFIHPTYGKQTMLVGDRMSSHSHPEFDELLQAWAKRVDQRPSHLTDKDYEGLYGLREMIGREPPDMKVQYVRDPLTSGNHFAIGFVGSSGVHANFVEADKSGIDSMKKLAALLDKAHREESDLQKLATGIGLEPQEYLATDGHKFYGLTVGRPRRDDDPANVGEPLVLKKFQKLHVQGWKSESLYADLANKFDGSTTKETEDAHPNEMQEFLNQFDYKKTGQRTEAHPIEIQKHLNYAFKQQSKRVLDPDPNAVSASYDGYHMGKDPEKQPAQRFGHEDEAEVEKLKGMKMTELQTHVKRLVDRNLWNPLLDKHKNLRDMRQAYIEQRLEEARRARSAQLMSSDASGNQFRRGRQHRPRPQPSGVDDGQGTSSSSGHGQQRISHPSSSGRNQQPPAVTTERPAAGGAVREKIDWWNKQAKKQSRSGQEPIHSPSSSGRNEQPPAVPTKQPNAGGAVRQKIDWWNKQAKKQSRSPSRNRG